MASLDFVRMGFVGAGAIAESAARSVNSHAQARVMAIADPNCERVKQLCADYGIAHGCGSAEELFASRDVDAVYIAVPNKFHVPLTLKALEAGKHVMLEKPFAMNYAEALLVKEAVDRTGLKFFLGMNLRFAEQAQKFRVFAGQGVFGEIYHAKAYWLRQSGIPRLGTWFGCKELAGGGCLYDIGVHVLDVCLFLIGNFEPVSAFGAVYSKFGPRGLGEGAWGKSPPAGVVFDVDDFATGQIRFANGATVSLDVSWARFGPEDELWDVEIYGTEAGARVFADRIYRRDEKLNVQYVVNKARGMVPLAHKDRFHNFINHLLGREELLVKLEEALVVQKILDGLAESARTGESVRLS